MGLTVLIVDDSATARAVLTEILNTDPAITQIITAPDAYVARDKIVKYRPNVICLDVEMPRMDGITFLKKLMKYMPTPVVMVSSMTQKGAQTTLDALEAGAVDFVAKPHHNLYDGHSEIEDELLTKIHMAAYTKVKPAQEVSAPKPLLYQEKALLTTQKLIAMGASTGGTEAIKTVLMALPRNTPGIIITQHMPAAFTPSFAARLNDVCEMEVKEAENGDTVGIGKVLIAPGGKQMELKRSGTRYYVDIHDGEKVSGHKPSVNVLFHSVAQTAGGNAIGVLLTGMGEDGAEGLLAMHKAGAPTIGQDEKSCVVYGMPKAAYDLGAVSSQQPLTDIASSILYELSLLEQ